MAGTVAGIVVSCVVVVVLVTAIFGYIQYRRYKNRHIETAKFNFVILPPINTDSRWAQFKRGCRRRWYKLTGRRFKEGLVSRLDASSGHYTFSNSIVSYGSLLQSDSSCECSKDFKVLQDLASSEYHKNENDDR